MNSISDFLKRHAEKISFEANGCWVWTGCTAGKMEYGNLWDAETRTMKRAHRTAYEAMFGPIEDGKVACHKCDNPRCVNPHHIFQATQKENIADMWAKGRSQHQRNSKKLERNVR